MKSLDFLSTREVLEDCVRLAVIPSLVIGGVGCFIWGLQVATGRSGPDESRFALVVPFLLCAIYGNLAIYNIRAKHGIKVLRGQWWFRLTGLSITWSVCLVALGEFVEFTLVRLGLVAELRSVEEAFMFTLVAAGFALFFSLLPARERLSA